MSRLEPVAFGRAGDGFAAGAVAAGGGGRTPGSARGSTTGCGRVAGVGPCVGGRHAPSTAAVTAAATATPAADRPHPPPIPDLHPPHGALRGGHLRNVRGC